MSQLGQRTDEISRLGAGILALAVTATFSQQAFAATLGITFPLLSDWEGHTSSAYGVRYDSWKGHAGVAKRSLFVIGPNRVVHYRWHTADATILPDLDPALRVLAAMRPH
jgi:peroxiredoxin